MFFFPTIRPLYSLETLWYKDGIPIENTGISFNLNDPWNRTLSLLSANLTYTGKYKCVVSLRNVTVESEAQVTVLGTLACGIYSTSKKKIIDIWLAIVENVESSFV